MVQEVPVPDYREDQDGDRGLPGSAAKMATVRLVALVDQLVPLVSEKITSDRGRGGVDTTAEKPPSPHMFE
jgi:hypothetical protein